MKWLFGKIEYGKVDHIPGLCFRTTLFFHVWFFPLFPLSGKLIYNSDGSKEEIEAAISFKSVILSYIRFLTALLTFIYCSMGWWEGSKFFQETDAFLSFSQFAIIIGIGTIIFLWKQGTAGYITQALLLALSIYVAWRFILVSGQDPTKLEKYSRAVWTLYLYFVGNILGLIYSLSSFFTAATEKMRVLLASALLDSREELLEYLNISNQRWMRYAGGQRAKFSDFKEEARSKLFSKLAIERGKFISRMFAVSLFSGWFVWISTLGHVPDKKDLISLSGTLKKIEAGEGFRVEEYDADFEYAVTVIEFKPKYWTAEGDLKIGEAIHFEVENNSINKDKIDKRIDVWSLRGERNIYWTSEESIQEQRKSNYEMFYFFLSLPILAFIVFGLKYLNVRKKNLKGKKYI